jgi:CHAD domain-containing protein
MVCGKLSICMDAKALLLDLIEEGANTYRKNLKLCRDEFSRKTVHDLRISIRRLLAILDVVHFVTSASRAEKLSARLKKQLDDVSELRDIQVMLDRVSEDLVTLPELEPLQKHLKKREKRQQSSNQKQVQNIPTGWIKKRLPKLQEAVQELSADQLDHQLPQAVDEAYLTVVQRYSDIDPAQLVSIHHLRVAFKKFRYMVEAISPCLPDVPETLLQALHDYQTQMGDIHDLQVLLETLTTFAEDDDSYDPEPVRRFYERTLADQLSGYLKKKDDVLHFWRATPLVAFPWQKAH